MMRIHDIKNSLRRLRLVAVALAAFAAGGCDLDVSNPNAVTPEEVFENIDGVLAAAVGMQDIYANAMADFVQASALVTDEWGTRSQALLAWTSLLTGENFEDSYGTVEDPWAAAYRVIAAADNLIEGAPAVGLAPTFENAVLSLAHLYRGMALGQLYLHYASAPLAIDQDNPPAVDRAEVLAAALSAFDQAAAHWAATDPDELSGFNTRVLAPGFDMEETIEAMRARYNLFAGNWQAAMNAAESVDLSVLSVIPYSGTDENPIYDLSLETAYVAGLQSFVDDAEPGDERVEFWIDLATAGPQSNTDTMLVHLGQYSDPGDDFPVYLPDEMRLIRAEAHARLGQLEEARNLINAVRTQCESAVNEPVACLPPLTDAELATLEDVLAQIAYERRYELYMQGLRWEDVRRLDAYIAADAWLAFLPIPEQECLANTNIDC